MAYATKQSSAYDYGRFDPNKKRQVEILPDSGAARKRTPEKLPYVKYGMIFAIVFAVAMVIISSYMQVTVITSQNARMKKDIENLKSEENALNAKKEQLFNLSYVEQKAKEMGMIKLDKGSIQYIEMSSPDKSTRAVEEDRDQSAVVSGLVKSFNAVVEYLN